MRGTIEREPDRAGSGGPFGFWPRVLVGFDALAASELLREGSLVYHQYALRLEEEGVRAGAVQAEIGKTLRDAGWQVRTFEDAAPQVRRMVERLGSFLSLVGLTALLVGGVGVGNAVRAWLDTRLGAIATLKCIGASRRVVFSTYLSQLTVIAGLGVAAGLAVGALAPLAAGRLLETLLPTPVAIGVYPGGARSRRPVRPPHGRHVHDMAALPGARDPGRRAVPRRRPRHPPRASGTPSPPPSRAVWRWPLSPW